MGESNGKEKMPKDVSSYLVHPGHMMNNHVTVITRWSAT